MKKKTTTFAATTGGLLTRDNKMILISFLLNSIPYGYMNVVPLVYFLQVGYDPATIGIIYSAGAVSCSIGLIPFGVLADRFGRKTFVILGSAIPCISYAIFGLTLNPYYLIIAGIVGGVGFAGGFAGSLSTPSFFPLLAGSTPHEKRTTLFGLVEGAWISALSIGSFLSFLPAILISRFSLGSAAAHSESYFLMSALVIMSVVPLLFVQEKISMKKKKKKDGPTASEMRGIGTSRPSEFLATSSSVFIGRRRRSNIAKFALIYGLAGLGVGALVQVLPTWYSLRFGVSESDVGIWMALAQLISLVALPLIPRIARGRTVAASVGTGIAGTLFLIVMPLSGGFEIAALFFAIRSVLWVISWTVLQSYMVGMVPEAERATVTGIAFAAFVAAMSIGTFAGEALLGAGLIILPFLVGTIGYLGSSTALLLFFRRLKPPEEVLLPTSDAVEPSFVEKAI